MPRTAMVIGAGSPIGRAIAVALSTNGCRVVMAGPDAEVAERDHVELGLYGSETLDITDPESLEVAIKSVASRGALQTLVSCAAHSSYSPLRRRDYDVWRRSIEIGLVGQVNLLGACAGLQNRPDHIVLISSLNARVVVPGYAAYCAAKAGLEALVGVAALELAPGTTVNAVAPGPVNMPGRLSEALPAMLDATRRRHLLAPRLAEPEEIADVVAFLTSHKARWMTGQILTVDGGCGVNYGSMLDAKGLDEVFGRGGD